MNWGTNISHSGVAVGSWTIERQSNAHPCKAPPIASESIKLHRWLVYLQVDLNIMFDTGIIVCVSSGECHKIISVSASLDTCEPNIDF